MLSKTKNSNPKTLRFVEEPSDPLNWMPRNHQTIIIVDLKCFGSNEFLKYVSPVAIQTKCLCQLSIFCTSAVKASFLLFLFILGNVFLLVFKEFIEFLGFR